MPVSPSSGGTLRAATAMTVLGCSTGVTARLADYPLFGGQAVRYLLAALILLPVAARSRAGRPAPRPNLRELGRLTVLAATGLFGFNVLMVQALRHTDPAAVGSLVGCAPLLLAVLGPLLERRRPRLRLVAAAGVVVVGAAVAQGFGTGSAAGFLYALGTLGCEAAFSLVAVPLLPRLGPVLTSAYATVLAVPMFALTGLAVDGTALLRRPTAAELAALLYLAVLLTCVAFLLWYAALARLGAERAGLFAGLIPVAAALSGAVLGTGAPHAGELAGAALVGLGVCLGVARPRRPVRTVRQKRLVADQ
ncbi:DMT family transporter [Kitasatospora sp. NPDC056138]|uniref:DMT family transporter n=1 Tax=Kitasatospora sp. NPDC056138 TaxID=3345724 RepID=UPI0035D92B6A